MKFFSRFLGALLAVLLLSLTGAVAQSARFTGVTAAYDPAPNSGSYFDVRARATAPSGETYVWALYRGGYTLGGFVQPANPDTLVRATLLRLDAAGVVQWARPATGPGFNNSVYSMQVDPAGDVVVLGRSCCSTTVEELDGMPISGDGAGGAQAWVAKWSAFGVIQFARVVAHSMTGDLDAWHLAISPTGEMAFAGNFSEDLVIGRDTLRRAFRSRQIEYPGFFAKLTPTGAVRWVRPFVHADTLTYTRPMQVGFDQAGNLYGVGFYTGLNVAGNPGHAFLDGQALPVGYLDFWMRLDTAGHLLNVRTAPRPLSPNSSASLVVAPDGSSYSAYSLTYRAPQQFSPGVRLQAASGVATFVFRRRPDGSIVWIKQLHGRDTTDAVLTGATQLALGASGELLVSGALNGVLQTNDLTLGAPGTGYRRWVVALATENGGVIWGQATGVGLSMWLPYSFLAALPRGGAQLIAPIGADSLSLGSLLFSAPGNHNYKTVFARLSRQYSTLGGAAYLDANADGVLNSGEGGFPGGLVVEVNPGNIPCAAPETTGRYNAYLDLNVSYAATLPHPPPHYTVVAQGPATTTFSAYGNVAAGRSFALQPIPNQQDVQVILTLVSPARPGNLLSYQVQYRNVGTVAIAAGAVTLAPDARLVFLSSTQPATGVSGQSRTWAYAALLPGQVRRFNVVFRLPATTPLGVIISSTATIDPIAGDLAPADNSSEAGRVVTGSYDPNDITVNHLRLSTTQVQSGEWLEYTIRFQNHGTDTAFTVLVVDSLTAAKLQLSTLQILAASHNCNWGLSPAGVLQLRFADAQLAPQLTDPLASDGFIRFRVQPAAALIAGDQIPNRARIHFDYNAPLATNTVQTNIDNVAGTAEGRTGAGISIWPNPATGTLHVSGATDGGPLTLTLLNGLGRLVLTQTAVSAATALDVRALAPGVYVLRGVGTGAPWARRVVVR